ncbi:MAG: hypothetical protein ACRDSH_14280, partial [Pseudonocardiaceae bacterium]
GPRRRRGAAGHLGSREPATAHTSHRRTTNRAAGTGRPSRNKRRLPHHAGPAGSPRGRDRTGLHPRPTRELLRDVRTSARQIGRLLDGRATLTQRRRLLIDAGWTALLAATLHVDLGQRGAASTARTVAGSLGRETEHDEISAWGCEVATWTALVDQDWSQAASLAAAGEALAPTGSPAAAQLAMQAARAAARLGDGPAVRAVLRRAAVALEQQSQDRPPDNHFHVDPAKLELYTGTALSWLGDPAAEDIARHAAADYQTSGRRRRLATAYLDLGLVLARLGRPDEAAHCGVLALGANHLVPSNAWRADELITAVSGYRCVPEVEALHELAAQRGRG